jgi:hypothetical protein
MPRRKRNAWAASDDNPDESDNPHEEEQERRDESKRG